MRRPRPGCIALRIPRACPMRRRSRGSAVRSRGDAKGPAVHGCAMQTMRPSASARTAAAGRVFAPGRQEKPPAFSPVHPPASRRPFSHVRIFEQRGNAAYPDKAPDASVKKLTNQVLLGRVLQGKARRQRARTAKLIADRPISGLRNVDVIQKLLWEERCDRAAESGDAYAGGTSFCRGRESCVAARDVANHLKRDPGKSWKRPGQGQRRAWLALS